jgi:ligand-binding SRPBCC domain-containing protein
MWHHEHHFEKLENGLRIKDRVTYKIPFGFIGQIVHSLYIQKKLIGIFSFRAQMLEKKFRQKQNFQKL